MTPKEPPSNNALVLESAKAVIATIALIGAIALGYTNPDRYGDLATIAISTTIGGCFGSLLPGMVKTR